MEGKAGEGVEPLSSSVSTMFWPSKGSSCWFFGDLVVVFGVVLASASRLVFLSTRLRWMKLKMKFSSLPLRVFFAQSLIDKNGNVQVQGGVNNVGTID